MTPTIPLCANCERYDWSHGRGACNIDGRERNQGFSCTKWVRALEDRCGTCMGEAKIWKDGYLWPCPTCDSIGIDCRTWVMNKDITKEMRAAHHSFMYLLSYMAADVPKTGGYATPPEAIEMGIRVCEECGKPNPVERSHCKGCDYWMNLQTKL